MARTFFEWMLGIPWVFRTLRPCVLGGIEFGPAYDILNVQPDDVILDVGCGMGDAMNYLPAFRAYHGFDTDARAIAAFRARFPRGNMLLYDRHCRGEDIAAINPTKVLLIGLLHHIADPEAVALLQSLAAAAQVKSIVTLDTVFLPRRGINNVFSRLDRGRFVRTVEGYHALVERSGLTVAQSFWIDTRCRLTRYYGMALVRSADTNPRVNNGRASAGRQGMSPQQIG